MSPGDRGRMKSSFLLFCTSVCGGGGYWNVADPCIQMRTFGVYIVNFQTFPFWDANIKSLL